MKNTIFGLNKKKDTAEELISNLEDRIKIYSARHPHPTKRKKKDLKYERKVKTSKKF